MLAYHGLGRFPRELDPYNLMLDPARLRAQVRSLRRRGYSFVRLSQLAGWIDGRPPRAVCALTFDDGTLDNLTLLAPLLRELRLPATVFACPGILGEPHFAMPPAAGVRLMDAGELQQLSRFEQIEIGSHTVAHTDLSRADGEQALADMSESKRMLEELLQREVGAFAYPKCDYSRACPQAAESAGYELAVTCAGRGGWKRFELARESIAAIDGRLTFELKSRKLFDPLRASSAGRLATRALRPLRHRSAA